MTAGAATTDLATADGVRLAARWWEPATETRRAVVVVHGFAGGKDEPSVKLVARRLAETGYAVLVYDSRGHGQSGGLCTLGLLERLDVDAAVAAARSRADTVALVATSMGSIGVIDHLATAAGGERPGPAAAGEQAGPGARGAVVVAAPAYWEVPRSWRGFASVMLTQTGAGRAVAARRFRTRLAVRPARGAPPVERIRDVTQPIALIHGEDDRFLSPLAAKALYEAAREPRRLDLVAGMGHGFTADALDPIAAAVHWVTDVDQPGAVIS